MGLKENMINNWKDLVIECQGKQLYVVEQIEYKGDMYIYTFNIDKLPDLEINFLKKVKDSTFEVITDMKLFDILLAQAGIKLAGNEIEKMINE